MISDWPSCQPIVGLGCYCMTVSTALKKINFIDTFCYKYCYYGEEGYLLPMFSKEESVHWMIFVMLFMWSCCIDGVILWLGLHTTDRLTDRQSDISLCESEASLRCPSCALSNVSLLLSHPDIEFSKSASQNRIANGGHPQPSQSGRDEI